MEAVEVVESSVEQIRYPNFRAELVQAVRALSDPDYQQRVWVEGEVPAAGRYDFTHCIHILFDDMSVLPEPEKGSVGAVIYPNEVDAMKALGGVLDPLIDELSGTATDAAYLTHSKWAEVMRRAKNAYQVLRANDDQHSTDT